MTQRSLRSKHSPSFKAKVALEAYKEDKTSTELSSEYGVHPGLIRHWKGQLVQNAPRIFTGNNHIDNSTDKLIEELYKKIGKL